MSAVIPIEHAEALARPASQLLEGRTIAIRGSHDSIPDPDLHDLVAKHGGKSITVVRGNAACKMVILSPHKCEFLRRSRERVRALNTTAVYSRGAAGYFLR